MRPRIALARFLIRLGSFIQAMPIMVMRPDDLIEFSRQFYARQNAVEIWSNEDRLNKGLHEDELKLLEYLPVTRGRLLLLGVGGGREAIHLARLGYEVTGLDFVPEMVDRAIQNANSQGLVIKGLIQEISKLELKKSAYDVIWLSKSMYSSVPTRHRRLKMLANINKALSPEGYFVCQFFWQYVKRHSLKLERARKALAWLTLGNIPYEPGDILWHNIEFLHAFLTEEELLSEFQKSGFCIVHLDTPENNLFGGAILKKTLSEG